MATASKKQKTKAKAATVAAPVETVIAYKGFDAKLQCRGFQFEIGKTYEHVGSVEVCASGFHACEHPLDVFGYYPPSGSRFAVVEQTGDLKRHNDDTKIASAKITITAELRLSDMIERALKWVMDRAKPEGGSQATGYRGAASATGYSGAASATGNSGAASATGKYGRAQGTDGCALFLVYRDDNWKIIHAWAGVVGQDDIKPLTWYTLDSSGRPVECEAAE